MLTLYTLVMHLLSLYSIFIVANVVFSWLYAFNVINPRNGLVRAIGLFLYKVTEPTLRFVRQFLPNLGTLDISPAVVLLIIWVIESLMRQYFVPVLLANY